MNQQTKTSLSTWGAATVLAAVSVAGLSSPAVAGEGAVAPATSCSELWQSLPERLQRDLTAARSLPPRAQHVAMRSINQAALHGGYGEAVEELAEAREERRAELRSMAPDQLRADIAAARSLPFREQRRAMRVIRRAALSGVYGEGVQEVARARHDWLQTCPKSGDAI